MIKKKNSDILQKNCLRCHEGVVQQMAGYRDKDNDRLSCVHCHKSVGHGEPAGLGGPDRGEHEERNMRL
jgi:cytochrome c nitrite reductase small subunit